MAQLEGYQQAMMPEGVPVALPTHASPWPVEDVVGEVYEHEKVIGIGVYGTVYKGRHRETQRVVAIKKLRIEDDFGQGVPSHVLREIGLLIDFKHPNIVELLDVHVTGLQDYSLVFEFVDGDLHQLLKSYRKSEITIPMELARHYAYDLVHGLHACHVRLILHRDLKPQNVLIGRNGLKIGDFGLSRMFSLPIRSYTLDVVTLWYRAPEILLGCHKYGPEVDMWSAGCIIAEMCVGTPIFPGDSEIGTIFKIFKVAGTPSEETWPGIEQLENFKPNFPKWPDTRFAGLANARPEMGPEGAELLRSLLSLNPQGRCSARRARSSAFCQPVAQPPPATAKDSASSHPPSSSAMPPSTMLLPEALIAPLAAATRPPVAQLPAAQPPAAQPPAAQPPAAQPPAAQPPAAQASAAEPSALLMPVAPAQPPVAAAQPSEPAAEKPSEPAAAQPPPEAPAAQPPEASEPPSLQSAEASDEVEQAATQEVLEPTVG